MGSVLTVCYLIASVTFILGLKMLSNPATARRGNLIAAGGMTLAIIGTIFLYEDEGARLHNHIWIFAGIFIGGIAGTMAARKVQMTAMPEMVALTPRNSQHNPGNEVPEKNWMYRFAKKHWFFGFGAYT